MISIFHSCASGLKGVGNTYNLYDSLKILKMANINRLVIGHLNINSIRNKFEASSSLIRGNIDICVISETKIDESFQETSL